MADTRSQFSPLIIVPAAGNGKEAYELGRLPLQAGATDTGYNEVYIQNLFFKHPSALPIVEIDSSFMHSVPVCTELNTPAGPIDALYVNAQGLLTLAEFKLWRNPQARREVVGQILDYAKELASWDYEDLQREISRRLKRSGNALYELARANAEQLSEATFVDDVSRNLRKGRFLLLIVGDGIRENAESIIDYLQQHTGLQFTIALVEAAIYQLPDGNRLVQPRILARSLIVNRTVVELNDERLSATNDPDGAPVTSLSSIEQENKRFWTAMLKSLSLDDTTQRIPEPAAGSVIFFMFGFTGEVWVACFIVRATRSFGVYLSRKSSSQFGSEVFERLTSDLELLKDECSEDLDVWSNSNGQQRIGFSKSAEFLSNPAKFDDSVKWLQQRTNELINAVRPRIHAMWEDRD